MSVDLDELYASKHSLVNELFIKTADDNYVTARWCSHYDLDVDFFWLAVHCLEKYMKAALLLNGKAAKGYGHDIEKLYADVRPLAPELLPVEVDCPLDLSRQIFGIGKEKTENFIKRLYFYGQPDNRYQLIGYIKREDDLFKVDQLVFAVRRLCQPLESHFLGMTNKERPEGMPDQTRRERMLMDDPSSRNLHSSLEKTIEGTRGKLLRRIALNWNFPFAPLNFKHGRMSLGSRSVNPVMVRRFLEPLQGGQDKHADDLWAWSKDNIQIPKEFVAAYERERISLKAKARAKSPKKA